MKQRSVRSIIVLVLSLMLIVSMVGCGGKTTDTAQDTTPSSQGKDTGGGKASTPSKEPEKKAEPVLIDWLGYNSYGVPNVDSEVVKTMEEAYNAKFNFWFLDTTKWDEMLAIKLAAGDCPDFMKVPRNLAKYVEQGIVGEITQDMIDKMPNYKAALEEYVDDLDDFFLDATIDGKFYALKSISKGQPTTVIWRTDWLRNVGINKIPETLEEFEDAMYKFTFNDPDQNGKDDTYGMSENIMHMVFGAFAPMPLGNLTSKGECNLEFVKKDGKYMIEAIQPEMKEPLRLLQKWYKDGVIDPEFITGENKGGYWAVSHSFVNGRVGVTGKVWIGHWRKPLSADDKGGPVYQEMKALHPDLEFDRDFGLGRAVTGPDGVSGTIGGGINGGLFAISSKALKDPEKVDTILKMIDDTLGDYDRHVLLGHGIKDKHYSIDEAGVLAQLENYNTPQTMSEEGITVFSPITRPDFQERANPVQQAFVDEHIGPGHPGPKVPASDVLDKYKGDLSRLAVNFYIEVITGDKDVDEFDDFVKTFRENGGDEIEVDVNAIYQKTINK